MANTDLTTSPLAYLAEHLDTIKKLGVTVLHLMPPFPMGKLLRKGIGSPYAVRDYKAVDEEHGSIEELKALVESAHREGLKIILGMVPNHTSRDHVWAKAHPDYYVKAPDGTMAYDIDWTDTAKLNYEEPSLREAMIDVYDYWLSFLGNNDGFDGFRVDMAHFINDLTFWNDALPTLKNGHSNRQLLFMAECYGMENNIDLFARGFNAAYDDDFYKCGLYFYGSGQEGFFLHLAGQRRAEESRVQGSLRRVSLQRHCGSV